MGQRLVITVHAFDEDIAKIYYHWSAYTISAFQEAKDIIDNVDWFNSTTNLFFALQDSLRNAVVE